MKVRVKADAFRIVGDALDVAIESGMNKTDKYCESALTDAQRSLLREHTVQYFWNALDEAGVELV